MSKTVQARCKQLVEDCCATVNMYPTTGELEKVAGRTLGYKTAVQARSKTGDQYIFLVVKVKSLSLQSLT